MIKSHRTPMAIVSIVCLAFLLMVPAQGWTAQQKALHELENNFVNIAENVTPSVVHLQAERRPLKGLDKQFEGNGELFKIFPFPHVPEDFRAQAIGSGVILSKDGYILTNNHLIEGADSITAKISDSENDKGTEYEGRIIGRDPATDLAVVKIDPQKPLHEAILGDSSKLKVGQWAIAIGDPFGLEKTVTVGVISGLGRSDFTGPLGSVRYQDFIQTDASINPGNSGGPLLNSNGEVIGINTFIQAAGSGLGFAIPINMAKEVYTQLVEHGEVIRGFLGVSIGDLDEGIAASLKVPDQKGALVNSVVEDSPAEKAGLLHGDVIRTVDGTQIDDAKTLQNIISHKAPGQKVEIVLLREGKEKQISVELAKFPEQEAVAEKVEKKQNLLGLTVEEVSGPPAAPAEKAVVITDIDMDGPAGKSGLAKGDVILEINMQEADSIESFNRIIKDLQPGQWVSFYVRRGDQTLYKALKVPANE